MNRAVQKKSSDCPDLLLIFPPQWSPFQPPLSLPSLAAWLRRAGYNVECLDLNVEFFYWLLSDECAGILRRELAEGDWSEEHKLAYTAIIDSAPQYLADLNRLRAQGAANDAGNADYITRHFIATRSLETYLSVISDIYEDFVVSPYEFHLKEGNLNTAHVEEFVTSPPKLLEAFVDYAVDNLVLPTQAMSYGLSCIGQEQLIFSLLIGARLKSASDAPVFVGGTIFSRIFERGNLKPDWFARYFDIVVRNEGEIPTQQLLNNLKTGRALVEDVSGIVFIEENKIKTSGNTHPLHPSELPIPDFDGMPLGRYLSAEVTLPILSARGCYWGKCEFCHHGMVYGEKYEAYQVEQVYKTIESLSAKHGVHLFAFNDEAIPPKIVRQIAQTFPANSESGWNFTGLIKFEKYFTAADFQGIYDVGFRSLYVGLESASERVLALMRKNNKQETMLKNLKDATDAGIWMHCFLFFGFPGETEADAQETYDFIMNNSDIIGSVGCGTFSFEHNAPIHKHYNDFGISLRVISKNDLDVYYRYDVEDGIDAVEASRLADKFNTDIQRINHFRAGNWIARDHLLCLLSKMPTEIVIAEGLKIVDAGKILNNVPLRRLFTVHKTADEDMGWLLVNRVSRRVVSVNGEYKDLLVQIFDNESNILTVEQNHPSAIPLFYNQESTKPHEEARNN